jgi:F0F1-type ATP synthase gamma subunit
MKSKSSNHLKKANHTIESFMDEFQEKSYQFVAIEYNDYCNDIRQELMKNKLSFDEWFEIYVSNDKKG